MTEDILALIRAAVAAEREACAKVAEDRGQDARELAERDPTVARVLSHQWHAAEQIASAIRARQTEPSRGE